MKLAESKSFKNMTGNAFFAPVIYTVQRSGESYNGIYKVLPIFSFSFYLFSEVYTIYFPAFMFLS